MARIDRQSAFSGTKEVAAALRFDEGRLAAYLAAEVPGFRGPLTVRQFKGGQSNPTYFLETPQRCFVLRRKPPGKLLPSAHAVDREFRVMAALHRQRFPVPEPVLYCDDPDIAGTAFFVMGFVDGRIFWEPDLPASNPAERAAIYDAANAAIARLHGFDPAAIGLADFGRGENYVARQVERWSKQYRASQTDDIDDMERLIEWLPRNIPPAGPVRLVHGDFRLDNVIIAADAPVVRAVLDWELSTLGNPLADIANFCMCLRLPPGGHIAGLAGLNREALGVPDETSIVERYCELRGMSSIENWNFYLAFSFFRFAAIAQGVKKRALSGNASNAKARQVGQMTGALARMGTDLI